MGMGHVFALQTGRSNLAQAIADNLLTGLKLSNCDKTPKIL